MNLENKTVTIEMMSVVSYPPETTVTVNISEEIFEGLFRHIGKYDIKFDSIFHSSSDPYLLQLVNEKLSLIPD
jgi:hypothetical protein